MSLAWGAVLIGAVFGVLGQLSRFCLYGGLRDWWQGSEHTRIRAFAVALAVALLGTQWLAADATLALERTIYLQAGLSLPAMLLGGVLFGFGMVLAKGCGARSLVLLGGGNLRSLVVLLALAVSAYMTLSGVLAPLRTGLVELFGGGAGERAVTLPAMLLAVLPDNLMSPVVARWIVAGLIAAVLLALALPGLRAAPLTLLAGAAIGVLIVAGWYLTGHLAADDFEPVPVESLTFVAPIGESLLYLMLASGMSADFGVCVVAGVLLGACAAALLSGRFSLQGFESPRRMLRQISGGVLMGVGGVLALGCSIGQGLSGFSTLAVPSLVAAAGIVLGALAGLKGPLRRLLA